MDEEPVASGAQQAFDDNNFDEEDDYSVDDMAVDAKEEGVSANSSEQAVESMQIKSVPGSTVSGESVMASSQDPDASVSRTEVASIADKDTAELDDKHRRDTLGTLEKIEREFADLKEKFFCREDRITEERIRNN